jgi:hypothetical protein
MRKKKKPDFHNLTLSTPYNTQKGTGKKDANPYYGGSEFTIISNATPFTR